MNNLRLKTIVKLFETCRYKHDLYSVFSDWCECAAISMSNAVDLVHFEKREARYLEIVGKYDRPTIETFTKIMGEVMMAMGDAPQDILGATFHALELHNEARGQFFTPYPICRMMAMMLAGSRQEIGKIIEKRGFMVAQEPAVGSGAMIVALAEAIREAGFNYQQMLHVTAVDIDRRAVHMGGWNAKLRGAEQKGNGTAPMPTPATPGSDGAQAGRSRAAAPNEPSFGVEKTGQLRLF